MALISNSGTSLTPFLRSVYVIVYLLFFLPSVNAPATSGSCRGKRNHRIQGFACFPGRNDILFTAMYTFAGKTAIIKNAKSFPVICCPFFTQSKTEKIISKTPETSTMGRRKGSVFGTILRKPRSWTKCKTPAPINRIEYSVRKNTFIYIPPLPFAFS